jgi:hypothetical protein
MPTDYQGSMFPLPEPKPVAVTVHCFWAWCPTIATATDPQVAHDLMEQHYRTAHPTELRQRK